MAEHIEKEDELSSHDLVSNSAQSSAISRSSPQQPELFFIIEKNSKTTHQDDWNETKAE